MNQQLNLPRKPDYSKFSSLLAGVTRIVGQNEQLSALKGENFNVFQLFNIESDENKMHSRFIHTLLNPQGCHGRGAAFLKLFLDTIDSSDYFENLADVKTKTEHPIGEVKINEMGSTGGRIDIFLWDSKKSISIENKIYAIDQEKQIVRYCNYKKGSNKVFYLNLYGTEPDGGYSKGILKSDKVQNDESPDFYCISYSETVLKWLEKCQKEASNFPVIRETIKQYIITIKRLTGQLTNQNMNTEIEKLIIANYESASIIAKNFHKAKVSIADNFLGEIKTVLEQKLGDSWVIQKGDITKKWSALEISNRKWRPKCAITLQGQPSLSENESILGLPLDINVRKIINTSFNENNLVEIQNVYPKTNKVWFFYRTVFNLGDDSQFSRLLSTETKMELIENLSTEIVALAKMIERPLEAELA